MHQLLKGRPLYGSDLLNQKMNRVHFHPHLQEARGNVPVEGMQPSQPEQSPIIESSGVKKRMVRKGSAAIAEQGSLSNLRDDEASASSIGNPKAKSPSQPETVHPKQSSFRGQQWSEFPDDPPESFNTAIPAIVPMAKAESPSVPKSVNPSAAAVSATRQGSSDKGNFCCKLMRQVGGL